MAKKKHNYWQLLFFKVRVNLQAEAAQNYLSYLWWIFEPVLNMLVFYLVFGVLLQRGTENFVAFLLTGLIPWLWFNKSITNSMLSIVGGRGLFTQVHLPKIILPSIVLLQDTVKQSIVFLMLLIFLLVYGITPALPWLALPVLLVIQFTITVACAFMAAAIVPFVMDIRFLISAGLQLMMFGSGVFYSIEMIPEQYHSLFFLNPMATLIHGYRRILLDGQWPEWPHLGAIFIMSIVAVLLMAHIFKKLDHVYPRVVI